MQIHGTTGDFPDPCPPITPMSVDKKICVIGVICGSNDNFR
jgi:hypothetical protein